jgi:hypothetical protein
MAMITDQTWGDDVGGMWDKGNDYGTGCRFQMARNTRPGADTEDEQGTNFAVWSKKGDLVVNVVFTAEEMHEIFQLHLRIQQSYLEKP